MSHVDTNMVLIKDLAVLQDTIRQHTDVEFILHRKTYKWYGASVGDYPLPPGITKDMLGKCDHVIRLKGCEYEIGVVRVDGGWRLAYDFWGPGQALKQRFGDKLNGLMDEYQHQLARKTMKGYSVHKITSQEQANKWNTRLGLLGSHKIKFTGKMLSVCVQ